MAAACEECRAIADGHSFFDIAHHSKEHPTQLDGLSRTRRSHRPRGVLPCNQPNRGRGGRARGGGGRTATATDDGILCRQGTMRASSRPSRRPSGASWNVGGAQRAGDKKETANRAEHHRTTFPPMSRETARDSARLAVLSRQNKRSRSRPCTCPSAHKARPGRLRLARPAS